VFMSGLARQIGVETPTMDAMIQITSVLMNRDYAGEALRTPETLGIDDLSAAELGSL
jgi:opine dehydrogenase